VKMSSHDKSDFSSQTKFSISNKVEAGSQIPDQQNGEIHMVHALKAVGGSSPLGR